MTICVSVRVPEGVVLGTDSMSTVTANDSEGVPFVIKNYLNARKLFQVGDLPIGVFIYGLARIGSTSLSELIHQFGDENEEESVPLVADGLTEFIARAYADEYPPGADQPRLGLYIAGYSQGSYSVHEREVGFPQQLVPKSIRRTGGDYGVVWRGVEVPFYRLYMGCDPVLLDSLSKKAIHAEAGDQFSEQNRRRMLVPFEYMYLQDAADFAVFVLRTTIGYNQFEVGLPTCGGELQVAAISAVDGFQWIREPQLDIPEDEHDESQSQTRATSGSRG